MAPVGRHKRPRMNSRQEGTLVIPSEGGHLRFDDEGKTSTLTLYRVFHFEIPGNAETF